MSDGKVSKRSVAGRNGGTLYPGNTGQPRPGRPQARPWAEMLKQKATPEILEKLAAALIRQGIKGKVDALKEFGDRTDGKVVQPHSGQIEISDTRLLFEEIDAPDIQDEAAPETD